MNDGHHLGLRSGIGIDRGQFTDAKRRAQSADALDASVPISGVTSVQFVRIGAPFNAFKI